MISLEILQKRLSARGSENEDALNIRLNKAESEISRNLEFDKIVLNDILMILKSEEGIKIEIGGHADKGTGDDFVNDNISKVGVEGGIKRPLMSLSSDKTTSMKTAADLLPLLSITLTENLIVDTKVFANIPRTSAFVRV